MATLQFPLALFAPSDWSWRIDGAVLEGGQPIAGAPQTAEISGGGYWACEHRVAMLHGAEVGQYRAMLSQIFHGAKTIVVPVLDALVPVAALVNDVFTADPSGADITADPDLGDLTADGLPTGVVASLAAPGYMQAYPAPPTPPTQAQITVTGGALQGYEYFTVIGPSGAPRLHLIHSILDRTGNVYTVAFNPPFREDMAAATAVDFVNPRCTMKIDLGSVKDAWPELGGAFLARPTIRFMEGGFVTPSSF